MKVVILGAAAGGGLPQWNCRCSNCQAARDGASHIRSRTQSSVAISADDAHWFLLNVSADVRQQLASCNSLWPPAAEGRSTRIAGCLLTDAEIDHTSGLLQLREGCSFSIYATPQVRRWLTEYHSVKRTLDHFAERTWQNIELGAEFPLMLPGGLTSGLVVHAFETGRDRPRFVPADETDEGSIIGLFVRDTIGDGGLLYAPGVARISNELRAYADEASCILVDGTFWTNEEPRDTGITERTSLQMGHVPVDGEEGTLHWLSGCAARDRVYIHINNTNPMLDESGPEYRRVTDRGCRVGCDGDSFEC